jgi:hypothetical protein
MLKKSFLLFALPVAALGFGLTGCGGDAVVAYEAPKETFPEVSGIRKQLNEAHAGAGGARPHPHPGIDPHAGHAHGPGEGHGELAPTTGAGASGVQFSPPEGWEEQPLGTMRKASFLVRNETGAAVDISVMSFPGDTGGLHANVNRWRGQVGLPSLAPASLEETLERRTIRGREYILVDMAGPASAGNPAQRITGAIHSRPAETWFFKMMGESELTAAQREPLLRLLESAEF